MAKQYKRRKEHSKGRLSEAAYRPERGRGEGDCKYSGTRATVSIAGRGTEHSWRKKSEAVGSMEGGRAGGIGGPAQEETMEAAVLGQEICGNNNWMR